MILSIHALADWVLFCVPGSGGGEVGCSKVRVKPGV